MTEAADLRGHRRRVLIIPLLTGVFLILLGYLYFRYEMRIAETDHYKELSSVGKLKATQVASWYSERHRDATYFSTSVTITTEVERYKRTGAVNRQRVIRFFGPVYNGGVYEELLLVTTGGSLIFSVEEGYELDSLVMRGVRTVMKEQQTRVHNLYYCHTHKAVHSDILAPVFVDGVVEAVLILRLDPYDFLYPYLMEWPVPSKTAEAILAGKRGDSVLFMNEMRKKPNMALTYTIPLSDTMVPAVMAVRGRTGSFKGRDYVGERVLSDLRMIPGTPWALVVKIDRAEVNDEVLLKTSMVSVIILIIIAVVTTSLVFGYRRKQAALQRLREKDELERFAGELQKQVAERTVELSRSNEDLRNFAHVISHDLKEPVRKILFLISVTREKMGDEMEEGIKSYFKKIEQSAGRLRDLVDGVLKYSEVHNTPLEICDTDLNSAMKDVQEDLELLIREKEAVIETVHLPVIKANDVLMYQLFYNLINNALKFSRPGVAPHIVVESHFKEMGGRRVVVITVTDNGIGFGPEYAESIFQSFKRLHSKDAYEGSGLGLALCKKIAERHNGTIKARSLPTGGSAFTVTLPYQD